jgi:hypothetical protein
MREAFGGALLLKLMLAFIVIYMSFLAISINYSGAFTTKNKVLKIIEECEGLNECATSAIASRLPNITCSTDFKNQMCYIEKINTDRGPYYKVTTYVKIELPIIQLVTNVPISGETKVIYHGK